MKRVGGDGPALAALVLLLVLRFPGVAAGTSVFSGSDHAWVNLPYRAAVRDAFLAGEAPGWDKKLSCGSPLLAQGEAGAFYAGHAALALPVDLFRAYGWTLLAHLVALGVATYVLLRRFGSGPATAAGLAATLGLSPYVLYNLPVASFFETLWLAPVALLCWDLARRGAPVLAGAAGGLALGEEILCGRPEWIHLWVAVAAAAAAHAITSRDRAAALRRVTLFLALAGALGIGLGTVQWLPTREFIPWSSRGAGLPEAFAARGSWLSWDRLYLLFLFPCFPAAPGKLYAYVTSNPFVGIVPFTLAVVGASAARRDRERALPAAVAAATGICLALGPSTPWIRALWEVPPLSMLRFPGRALPAAYCGALILAAAGWSALRSQERGVPWRALGVAAAAVAAGVSAIVWQSPAYSSVAVPLAAAVLQAAPLAACLAVERWRSSPRAIDAAVFAALAIQCVTAFSLPSFTEPRSAFEADLAAVAPAAAAPDGERRVLAGALDPRGARNSPALGNGAILAGAEVINEYQDFTTGPWRELLRDEVHPRVRGDAALPPPAALADLTGLSWMLLPGSREIRDPEWEPATPLDPSGAPRLWRRSRPGRTAVLVHEAVRVPSAGVEAALAAVRGGSVDFERQVLLDAGAADAPSGDTPAPADDVRETGGGPNGFRFEVAAASPGWLVVRDQAAPGWSARVDGSPVPLLRADGVFKAVAIPAGRHRVEMRYEAPGFRAGAIVSLLSGAALVAAALAGRRRLRERRAEPR